uniref:Transcription factor Adf-1 n=1 Tax=Schizaphis graminum TaxID=13262 RepID=A0A2S2PPH3_SCHGA
MPYTDFEKTELLISEIQKHNVLWNKSHKKYKDRLIGAKAWAEVSKVTGITGNEAKKRWRNLRDQFKKELKKVKKPKSGSSQDGLEKYHGKWSYFMSMQFLKDIETPRKTSGTFSNDDDEDIEIGHSYEHKSDSNEEPEDEDDIDKKTTHSFEGMDSLLAQTDVQTQVIRNNSPINELNNSKTKTSGQKKNKKKEDEVSFEQQLLQLEKTKIEAFIDSSRNAVKDDEDMYFLKSIHPYFGNMTPLQKLRVRTQIQEVIMRELSVPSSQSMNNNLTYPYQSYPISVQPMQSSQPIPFQPIHHPMQALATEQSLPLHTDPPNYN